MKWTLADWRAGIDATYAGLDKGSDIVASCCGEDCEGGFSWSPCEVCGCSLGGDRHKAAIIVPGTDTEPIELDCCVDCLCFLANGDEPEYPDED